MKIIAKIKEKIYKFLKWSEKYTQTDMIYLAKGGSWLLFFQITSTLFTFLLSIAFANLVSKEVYGLYKYIISIFAMVSTFTLPGIQTSLIQAVSRKFEGNFFEATKKRICFGFLGSLVLIFLSGYYFLKENLILSKGFLIASLFLPFFYSFNTYHALFNGRKRFDLLSKFQILEKGLSIFILIIILIISKNLFFILIGYFLSYSLVRILLWLILIKKYPPNLQKDPTMISYGKHLSFIQILGNFTKYIDKILVFHYLGAVPLAIYHFATATPSQIMGILTNIRTLALPKFSQRKPYETKKTLNKKIFKFGLFILGIVIVYILLCPFIYEVFFPKYKESIFYSQIFSLSLFGALSFIPSTFLTSQREIKKIYQCSIINSFTKILITFLAIYFWGLFGLVIGVVLVNLLNSL